MFVRNTILTSPEGGMATPLAVAQTLDGPRPERVAPTCQVITVSAQTYLTTQLVTLS